MALKDIFGISADPAPGAWHETRSLGDLMAAQQGLMNSQMANQQSLGAISQTQTHTLVDPNPTISYPHNHEFIVNWANGAVSGEPYCKWCKRTEVQCVAKALKK